MKKDRLIFILLIIACISMSIGYATINSITSTVSGEVLAEAQDGIFITGVDYISGDEVSESSSYYAALLYSNIELSDTNDSYVIYQITIYNNSSIDYVFTKTTVDESFYTNDGISYELIDLDVEDALDAYSYITFQIKFYYTDNTVSIDRKLDSYISFIFDEVITVYTIDEVCSEGDNLALCIQKLYNTNDEGVENIYFHDNIGDYTNSSLEIGDYSYRYSGSTDDVLNYVCFGGTDCTDIDNLYRIIGIFLNDEGNYEVKLVKYDYASSNLLGTDGDYSTSTYSNTTYSTYKGTLSTINRYCWNSSNLTNTYNAFNYYNVWSYSYLNTINLNTNYLNNIDSSYANLIVDHTWIIGGNTSNYIYNQNALVAYNYEIISPSSYFENTYKAKIGLMYISDYYYSADPTYWSYSGYNSDTSKSYVSAVDYNWMYMGVLEEVITPTTFSNGNYIFYIAASGNIFMVSLAYSPAYGVRPTFYLDTTVTYISGDGSQNSPIIIG